MVPVMYAYGAIGKILPINLHFDWMKGTFLLIFFLDFSETNYKNEMQQLYKLKIGSAAVNSFDWHPSRTGLAVCSSFDKQINIVGMIA